MVNLSETLQNIFQINQLTSEIIVAIIYFVLAVAIGWSAYYVFSRYFSKWAKKTKTTLDDGILHNIKTVIVLLVILLGFYYALGALSFTAPYAEQLSQIFGVLEILLIAFAITRVTNFLIDWYADKYVEQKGKNGHLLFILKKVMQLVIYVLAFLAVLIVFKVDLSGVVVGLGVGGIAIALAVQNTLGDFFSAFSIFFDKPFEIGDFIVVGDNSGTVTNIGIRSTRVKLLQGEELIISNRELTTAQVRNFKKLDKRRVTFMVGVTYNTPFVKLKKIPEIITKIINGIELAEMNRVHFTKFGDFSLQFEVVYYVGVSDYGKYMDVQQQINFAIKEAFEEEGIEMAFPTQTIYLNK